MAKTSLFFLSASVARVFSVVCSSLKFFNFNQDVGVEMFSENQFMDIKSMDDDEFVRTMTALYDVELKERPHIKPSQTTSEHEVKCKSVSKIIDSQSQAFKNLSEM